MNAKILDYYLRLRRLQWNFFARCNNVFVLYYRLTSVGLSSTPHTFVEWGVGFVECGLCSVVST